MKKLKIILLFSLILYVIFIIKNNIFFCYYNLETKSIEGILESYKIEGNYLSAVINGKSKIKINYYFETEQELKNFLKNVQLGNTYTLKGNTEEISQNTNFHLFNYKNYLYSKKIYYKMNIEKISLKKENTNLLYTIKNTILKRINSYETKTYLKLFILGENELETEIKESYQSNGISHLFAISGMHITLFTSFLTYILSKIIKKENIILIIISIFLMLYVFLTNFSPSVIRAAFMYILININSKFKLKITTKEIIIMIASVLLLYNPYYIYNTGFVFSFLVSFTLVLFDYKINIYNHKIIKIFMTSLISFIVGIPIMINNYHSINLLTPIVNIIFVPYISTILFPLTLITFIFPFLNDLLKILITIQEHLSLFIDKYFSITLVLKHIPMVIFILYYILIYIVLRKLSIKTIIMLILILLFHNNINCFNKYSTVTFLDVGQGDSILIKLPHNNGNILIDTGGKVTYKVEKWKERSKYNMANSLIIPYLYSEGINELHYLILTHGDYDHMGEAINLVNNFKIKKVIFNCGEFNELEKELIDVLDEKGITYYSCINELNIDNNKLFFLKNKLYDNENDNSNVIYTELNNQKLLFMGDAGVKVEEDLIKKYNIKDIDVLKVGHHGSKTSTSKTFIDEINPKYSIISAGKNNRYGHPNIEVLSNLKNTKIYRTDQNGSIMINIKKVKQQIKVCKI